MNVNTLRPQLRAYLLGAQWPRSYWFKLNTPPNQGFCAIDSRFQKWLQGLDCFCFKKVASARAGLSLNFRKLITLASNPTATNVKNIVYIVEDNLVQQKMLQVHFEEMLGNYTVRTFANPDDMFAHLNEKPFAIVLDHFFSDKRNVTGLDYLRDLKENHPNIPVIYYTSANDDAVRAEVEKIGVEQYIHKDSASLVRLRTALDVLHEKAKKKGFFKKLFGK